jgi:hypothetical protein
MWTSPNSHCKFTAVFISAWLKCLFVIEEAELNVTGHIAMVQTFATGPICQTAGIVSVEERHQPPMQLFHDESHSHKPLLAMEPLISSLSAPSKEL